MSTYCFKFIFVLCFIFVKTKPSDSLTLSTERNPGINYLKFQLLLAGIPPRNFVARGDFRYFELNSPWQLRSPETHPLGFALPRHEQDVRTLVSILPRLGFHIVVKGGGHSFEKYSYGDSNSVVIDLRTLDELSIDASLGTATVGAGHLVGPLQWNLWNTGRVMIPIGFCPTVGISGSTLGGGLDANFASALGMALDNLLEVNIVNARGQLLVANKRSYSDLFWAIRGAGPSFGIVTKLKFRTHRAPEYIFEGTLSYDIDMFPSVVNVWQKQINQEYKPTNFSNSELVASATQMSIRFTDLSGNDHKFEQLRNIYPPNANISKVWYKFPDFLLAEKEFSSEWFRNSTKLDKPIDLEKLTRRSAQPVYQIRKSFFVQKTVGIGKLEELTTFLKTMPSTVSVWFESYGGAIRGVGPRETAFVHRGTNLYNAVASYKVVDPDRASIALGTNYTHAFFDLGLKIFNHKESYQNYVDSDLPGYLNRYYGQNLERLVRIKRKFDPGNVFYYPQSIPLSL